jgi:hypothetical protein
MKQTAAVLMRGKKTRRFFQVVEDEGEDAGCGCGCGGGSWETATVTVLMVMMDTTTISFVISICQEVLPARQNLTAYTSHQQGNDCKDIHMENRVR